MRRLSLPATALVGLLAVTSISALSACDASPYAATVDGSTIKQAALNTELRWAASAPNYTNTLLSVYKSLSNVQLTVAGSGSGTYSSAWTAYVLSQMIQGQVLSHALAARHTLPSSDVYNAALGGIEIENEGVTGPKGTGGVTQMNPSYLVEATQRLADHAVVETPLPLSDLTNYYSYYKADFYTQVCVTTSEVSVAGPHGGVDYPASKAQAETVVQQLTTGTGSADQGSSTCYTHEQLDGQSPSFINSVTTLAPGAAQVEQTNYGYQVVEVTSRQTQPLAGPVAQVLTALVYDIKSPNSDVVLERLESRAKVRVNPAYGSWHPATNLVGVVSPTASPSTPIGSSGSLSGSLGGSLTS